MISGEKGGDDYYIVIGNEENKQVRYLGGKGK
jgi:hypothetical protein